MKKLNKILLVLFFCAMGFLTVLPKAEAIEVTLDNHRNEKISAAFVYYDINKETWCCQGWWLVDPYITRVIEVPHDGGQKIYFCIQSGVQTIHGRSEGCVRWDVISDAFKYYQNDACPRGANFRAAYFNPSTSATGPEWSLRIN